MFYSRLSSKGENHIEDVREVLTFLQGAAAEYDCGLLLNHHTRKRERGEMRPRELLAIAEGARYNKRVLYRARAHLNGRFKDTLGRKHPRNSWALAEGD